MSATNYTKGAVMAEEKKESYNLQVRIPMELKEKLEKNAKETGVNLNQYILFLLMKDVTPKK